MKTCLVFLISFLVLLPGVPSAEPSVSSEPTGTGVITGKIFMKGRGPMAGGVVLFYDASLGPPPFKNLVRRLPVQKVDIDADGRFRAEMPAGKYYLYAFKRIFTQKTAPLQDGDYVFSCEDDRGKTRVYVINSRETLDIGTVSEAVPYRRTNQIISTGIEGVVRDSQGNPVGGVNVFVFLDGAIKNKPVFFSKTGPDGKYMLSLPSGTYYVRARSNLRGGPPEAGQLVGTYGGDSPAPVLVQEDQIRAGMDITVFKFLGRTPGPGAGPQSRFK